MAICKTFLDGLAVFFAIGVLVFVIHFMWPGCHTSFDLEHTEVAYAPALACQEHVAAINLLGAAV